jgi:hypothetical protein
LQDARHGVGAVSTGTIIIIIIIHLYSWILKMKKRKKIAPTQRLYTTLLSVLNDLMLNARKKTEYDSLMNEALVLFESIPEDQISIVHVNTMLGLCNNCHNSGGLEYGWNLYTRIAQNLPQMQLPVRNMLILPTRSSDHISSDMSKNSRGNNYNRQKNIVALTGMENIIPGILIIFLQSFPTD